MSAIERDRAQAYFRLLMLQADLEALPEPHSSKDEHVIVNRYMARPDEKHYDNLGLYDLLTGKNLKGDIDADEVAVTLMSAHKRVRQVPALTEKIKAIAKTAREKQAAAQAKFDEADRVFKEVAAKKTSRPSQISKLKAAADFARLTRDKAQAAAERADKDVELQTQLVSVAWLSEVRRLIGIMTEVHDDLARSIQHVVFVIGVFTQGVRNGEGQVLVERPAEVVASMTDPLIRNDPAVHSANVLITSMLNRIEPANLRTVSNCEMVLRRSLHVGELAENNRLTLRLTSAASVSETICTKCHRVIMLDSAIVSSPQRLKTFKCADLVVLSIEGADEQMTGLIRRVVNECRTRTASASFKDHGQHFASAGSFVAWATNNNVDDELKNQYAQRMLPRELCALSHTGHLDAFFRFWRVAPMRTRIIAMNPALRGFHVDAFPANVGGPGGVPALDGGRLQEFISLRLDERDPEFQSFLRQRQMGSTGRRLRRMSPDEVTTVFTSSASLLSSATVTAPVSSSSSSSMPIQVDLTSNENANANANVNANGVEPAARLGDEPEDYEIDGDFMTDESLQKTWRRIRHLERGLNDGKYSRATQQIRVEKELKRLRANVSRLQARKEMRRGRIVQDEDLAYMSNSASSANRRRHHHRPHREELIYDEEIDTVETVKSESKVQVKPEPGPNEDESSSSSSGSESDKSESDEDDEEGQKKRRVRAVVIRGEDDEAVDVGDEDSNSDNDGDVVMYEDEDDDDGEEGDDVEEKKKADTVSVSMKESVKRTVEQIGYEEDELKELMRETSVRSQWSWTYSDMVAATSVIAREPYAPALSPSRTRAMAEMLLYRVLPPRESVIALDLEENHQTNEVTVKVAIDPAVQVQESHSKLFETRVKKMEGVIRQSAGDASALVDMALLNSVRAILDRNRGNDPVAEYLGMLVVHSSPWSRLREGRLEDLDPLDASDSKLIESLRASHRHVRAVFPSATAVSHWDRLLDAPIERFDRYIRCIKRGFEAASAVPLGKLRDPLKMVAHYFDRIGQPLSIVRLGRLAYLIYHFTRVLGDEAAVKSAKTGRYLWDTEAEIKMIVDQEIQAPLTEAFELEKLSASNVRQATELRQALGDDLDAYAGLEAAERKLWEPVNDAKGQPMDSETLERNQQDIALAKYALECRLMPETERVATIDAELRATYAVIGAGLGIDPKRVPMELKEAASEIRKLGEHAYADEKMGPDILLAIRKQNELRKEQRALARKRFLLFDFDLTRAKAIINDAMRMRQRILYCLFRDPLAMGVPVIDITVAQYLWRSVRPAQRLLDYQFRLTESHQEGFLDYYFNANPNAGDQKQADESRAHGLFILTHRQHLNYFLDTSDWMTLFSPRVPWDLFLSVVRANTTHVFFHRFRSYAREVLERTFNSERRKYYARLHETSFKQISEDEATLFYDSNVLWTMLGPDELAIMPRAEVVGQLRFIQQVSSNPAVIGYHKAYVRHRLLGNDAASFQRTMENDYLYQFLRSKGVNLQIDLPKTREQEQKHGSTQFVVFSGYNNPLAREIVRSYGPFYTDKNWNVARYFIADVEISPALHNFLSRG